MRALGGEAIALSGDLSNVDVAPSLVEAAVSAFGGLDALVANAGVASPGNICDLSVAEWDKIFEVNFRGAWLLAKHCYPHLKQSRGAACFTSSMSGQQPHAGSGAYSPTKGALNMFAQTLALEWAPGGIRVNIVSPGMTHTPCLRSCTLIQRSSGQGRIWSHFRESAIQETLLMRLNS